MDRLTKIEEFAKKNIETIEEHVDVFSDVIQLGQNRAEEDNQAEQLMINASYGWSFYKYEKEKFRKRFGIDYEDTDLITQGSMIDGGYFQYQWEYHHHEYTGYFILCQIRKSTDTTDIEYSPWYEFRCDLDSFLMEIRQRHHVHVEFSCGGEADVFFNDDCQEREDYICDCDDNEIGEEFSEEFANDHGDLQWMRIFVAEREEDTE